MCDELHLKLRSVTDEKMSLTDHARTPLRDDQQQASDEIYVCTFDLQKVLPFPKLSTSVAYYKRNMYVLTQPYILSMQEQVLCMFGMNAEEYLKMQLRVLSNT